VTGTFFGGVTLSALHLEDFLAGLDIARRSLIEGRHSERKAKANRFGGIEEKTRIARKSREE